MRKSLIPLVLALAAGCGQEIGDSCVISSDCSPNGDRFCDSELEGGYCTVLGCDFNTCPDEAVCIAFFTGGFTNRECTAETEAEKCTLDEVCSLDGHCVTRKSELRNCMRSCESNGDCRDGYECRDIELMIEHGGQPVLGPGTSLDESTVKFCAPAPA